MVKYCVKKWDENKNNLKDYIKSHLEELDECEYIDLVELIVKIILGDEWGDTNKIVEIDNGDYQGTLLFTIPRSSYQPSAEEYLMTYVEYGSCSGCDTLLSIQADVNDEQKITDYMTLCRDIVMNTIKPYNHGWRHKEEFEIINEAEKEKSAGSKTTPQEAIIRIKEHKRIHFEKEKGKCPLITEALDIAIRALEKQIAKEPKIIKTKEDLKIGASIWRSGVNVYKCPECGAFINCSNNYCGKCGKKIKWRKAKGTD